MNLLSLLQKSCKNGNCWMYVKTIDEKLDYIHIKIMNENKPTYYLLWSYEDRQIYISKRTIEVSALPWIEFDFDNFDKIVNRIDKLLVFS